MICFFAIFSFRDLGISWLAFCKYVNIGLFLMTFFGVFLLILQFLLGSYFFWHHTSEWLSHLLNDFVKLTFVMPFIKKNRKGKTTHSCIPWFLCVSFLSSIVTQIILVMLFAISYQLYNLKKREKHPWKSVK